MANKSLTDLTARTATADTDLIHVNSGGTDYKETKANFLKGDFLHSFNNTSTLTSQVDALSTGTYFGGISGYGKQTETGLPLNANCYVKAQKYTSSTYSVIEIWSINNAQEQHWIIFKNNGTWGSWEHVPARSEITSLNNSLANGKLHNADHYFSNISVGSSLYVDLGVIESVFNIPAGSYIVSAFIRGWSGNPGALSLVISSTGTNLYLMCSATGTVSSVTVRVWYCATN